MVQAQTHFQTSSINFKGTEFGMPGQLQKGRVLYILASLILPSIETTLTQARNSMRYSILNCSERRGLKPTAKCFLRRSQILSTYISILLTPLIVESADPKRRFI